MPDAFVRYTPGVEQMQPDEQKSFDEIAASMTRLSHLMTDRYRHAIRSVHAKSHGLVKAELTVLDGLPPEYRQGLFAEPGKTYGSVLRFSTNPGDILADSISTPRGVAIKVIGVDGPTVPGHTAATQDFVIAVGEAFAAKDSAAFLKNQLLIERHANDPEPEKKIISAAVRGVNAVLGVVGLEQPALAALGYPPTHILGETFYTQAAIRYGDYVAKLRVTPFSANLKALADQYVDPKFHYSAILDAVVAFLKKETAQWNVEVQLCRNLETMPVEDASVIWKQEESPFVPVARLVARPQDVYSPARRVFVDDKMAFSPWHALEAHRPLGNIMRARKQSYDVSAKLRQASNAVTGVEPKSVDEIPD